MTSHRPACLGCSAGRTAGSGANTSRAARDGDESRDLAPLRLRMVRNGVHIERIEAKYLKEGT